MALPGASSEDTSPAMASGVCGRGVRL